MLRFISMRTRESLQRILDREFIRHLKSIRLWQRSEIALDINPSKMIEMLMTAGAKRVTLVSPLLDDPANVINERQIAYETKSSFLHYGGLEDK